MSARNEDFLFAQEAQNKGYVTEEQVEEAFQLQRTMAEDLKIDERVAVILVKRGWLAEEQARRIYAVIEPEGQQTRIQGYRLVERIGRGAMGTVYKAIHLGLHRVVAIKVLRPELLAEKVHSERLKGEAQMLASLDHPNIVRALDAGESNGFPYVVMEYVEGETLKERITREGPLPENEALRITRAIADALERARRMGVVHRDVKPGNILISKKGEPKLMDLGLARGPIDLELTQHGATVGTPQFMSPEQVEDAGKVDIKSDIYSLGATLYAMLTAKPPHTGATMTEILTRVLNEQPVAVRHHNPDVSPEVSYLVERMMLKDPELRYQTPAQVVDDIDDIVGGQSIVPSGFTGNWEAWLLRQRYKKRKKWALGIAIGVIVVGAAALFIRDVRSKNEAKTQVAQLEKIALQETPQWGDSLEDAIERRESVAKTINKIQDIQHDAGLGPGVSQQLLQLRNLLDAYVRTFRSFHESEDQCELLARNREYEQAYELADGLEVHKYSAIEQLQNNLVADILNRSEVDWHQIRARAKQRALPDLDAVVTLFREYAKALEGDFVIVGPGADIVKERQKASAMRVHVDDIEARILKFRATYSDAEVEAELRQDALARLDGSLKQDAKALRAVCAAPWPGSSWSPALEKRPLASYCETEIEKVEDGVDVRVRAFYKALRREASEMESLGRVRGALALLQGAIDGAGIAYPTLIEDLETAVKGMVETMRKHETDADRREQAALTQILASLRQGDVKRAERVARDAREAAIDPQRERRAEQLRDVIAAYEMATQQSLEYLRRELPRLRQMSVRLIDRPDGSSHRVEKFRVDRIDGQSVMARAQSHRGAEPYPITGFHVSQLVRWLDVSGAVVSDRDASMLQLLVLPNDPMTAVRGDPRVLQRTLGDLSETFDELQSEGGVDIYDAYVYDRLQTIKQLVRDREERAYRILGGARDDASQGYYSAAARKLRRLLDPNSPHRFTDVLEQQRATVETSLREAEEEEAKREIERWLLGVRAYESDYATRLRIDFDLEEHVLDLFDHGFGRLVKQRDTREVTPEAVSDDQYAFEMMPGVDGVMPGRPLTFESPFDPAHPLTVEFDLHTMRGAFFFAIDIDGVQLGVLSADPTWYPEWRIPEALRQGPNDDLVAFYGRGRGVAVHMGTGFGDVAGRKWNWSGRSSAHRRGSWAKGEGEGELFAFVPGRSYRVRLRREVDRLVLSVADLGRFESLPPSDREKTFRQVYEIQESDWVNVGRKSEVKPMSKGTGAIQLLSWSTVLIDDLDMTGVIRQGWREAMRAKEKK